MIYRRFLINLYEYLFNSEDCDNNIIRKHSRNLEKVGEFSFAFDRVPSKNNEFHVENIGELLVNESNKWPLQISKCIILNNNVEVFIERTICFKKIIKDVLHEGKSYGCYEAKFSKTIYVTTNINELNVDELNLSQLRVKLLRRVVSRLLEFNNCNNEENCRITISLSVNLDKGPSEITLLSGPVLCIKDGQKCNVTSQEFYEKRTIDMRLMAEHKYGLRVTSQVGWQEFFEKLGRAAVTIDLLQNKCNRAVTINLNDPTTSNSKGASFILYNCARLATLFKEFDKRVSNDLYPELLPMEDVDFSLLNQPEEWELLFTYVLQFPFVVNNIVKEIKDGKLHLHNLCNALSGMCSVFSVYYRRVRILTEPRDHLFAVLHARIYLLKSVEQVLHNGLYLLDIQPVKQM